MEGAAGELARSEQRVCVSAYREERGVAQVEEAGKSNHDVEPDSQQDVDARISRGADQMIARAARRNVGETGKEQRADDEQGIDGSVAIAESALRPAHCQVGAQRSPAHFSGTCIPRSPVGRKTSTRMRMAKIQTSVRAAWK